MKNHFDLKIFDEEVFLSEEELDKILLFQCFKMEDISDEEIFY